MLRGNRSGFPLWRLDVRPWGRNLWRKGWNLITHPSTPSHTHTVQEWKRKVNLNRNINIFLGKDVGEKSLGFYRIGHHSGNQKQTRAGSNLGGVGVL